MPVSESGRYALLGLLSLRSMSGYDLRQLIQTSISHFWSESFGQIYPTLHALAAERLIHPVKEDSSRSKRDESQRRKRQVYAITQAGLGALESWLTVPVRKQTPRNELLLKLFFGTRVPAAVSLAHVQEWRDKARQDLNTYQETERNLRRDKANHPNLPFWLITLRRGQLMTEADLRWSDETLRLLESLPRKVNASSKRKHLEYANRT